LSRYVIDYDGLFRFDAPSDAVWATITELDQFERWWSWLGHLTVDGDGLTPGTVLRGTVSPPLPYRMNVRVELERCIPAQLIDAVVHGDLEGDAHLYLRNSDRGTDAAVAWHLEMMQRPMRSFALFGYPILRWGHDMVVDATVRAFRARLRQPHLQRDR
jgi:hypothetical protein